MYSRASYENMIQDLGVFVSTVYTAQSYIQSACTVMTSAMEDDDEIKTTRADINKMCIGIAELTETAKSVAESLREEMERLERETQQRIQGDGGGI